MIREIRLLSIMQGRDRARFPAFCLASLSWATPSASRMVADAMRSVPLGLNTDEAPEYVAPFMCFKHGSCGSVCGYGCLVVAEFYDAAVSGAHPIAERPGFKAMLDRIAGNGIRCIFVESPDRFARDLTVQLTGHDFLKSLGVSLIPATAPNFFAEDTPTAVLVRQVVGAIAQFEKISLVAKLKAARDRKKAATGT